MKICLPNQVMDALSAFRDSSSSCVLVWLLGLSACGGSSLPDFATGGPTCAEVGTLQVSDGVSEDGCRTVTIPSESWQPLRAVFNPDVSDPNNPSRDNPIFQFHDVEDTNQLCLNIQLLPLASEGWSGQEGVFSTDCAGNGICISIYPNGQAAEADDSGSINIVALPTLNEPAGTYDIQLQDLRFADSEANCFRLETVSFAGEVDDLSPPL